jgi:metal-responsive CopG/Arc/MetJ family transcriptional regulator
MKVDSKTYGWITVKIQEDLAHEIDKEIASEITYGYPKYRSRSDFIKVASLMLLDKERSQHTTNRRKNPGEEILVARK